MKSRFVIILLAIVSTWIVCNRAQWKGNNFYYDSDGYYKYLPALFIHHDLYHVYENDENKAKGIHNKYPIGVAIFEMPLFLVAHGYCAVTHAYPQDGYSVPYQVAGIASNILWVLLGLILVRLSLSRFFSDTVIAIVLLCIAFGTNLYTYTVFDIGMSHPYSFFLFAGVLYCTERLYATTRPRYFYLLALLLGWITITRPVNIIVVIIPLLWGVSSVATLKQRLLFFWHHAMPVIGAALVFLLIIGIQLAYWKYAVDKWVYYSYGQEGFDFTNPHIWDGLFSYRKGWFVYTPIALISFLGLYPMWKKNHGSLLPYVVLFPLAIYVIFSWKYWAYGGSFGCRPFIEYLALLALPLGYMVQSVLARPKLIAIPALSLLGLLIALNIFQSYQYTLGIIHYDRMSRTYYWKVFGKTRINFAEYEKYLMDEKEYWKSRAIY